jgi:hypothetical protein
MYIKLHIDFIFKGFHLVHVMMFHLLPTVILLILDHNPPAVQLINIFGSHTSIVQAVILNGHIGIVVIIMILLFLLVLYLVIGMLQISYIFLQLLLGGLPAQSCCSCCSCWTCYPCQWYYSCYHFYGWSTQLLTGGSNVQAYFPANYLADWHSVDLLSRQRSV